MRLLIFLWILNLYLVYMNDFPRLKDTGAVTGGLDFASVLAIFGLEDLPRASLFLQLQIF